MNAIVSLAKQLINMNSKVSAKALSLFVFFI